MAISPYFIENEGGQPERITGTPYKSIFVNFLCPDIEENQRGATTHTCKARARII